jgi:hypothetical protein
MSPTLPFICINHPRLDRSKTVTNRQAPFRVVEPDEFD